MERKHTGGGHDVRPSVCQHQRLSWIFMEVSTADTNWKLWSRRDIKKKKHFATAALHELLFVC